MWEFYLVKAGKEDKERVDRWKGEMDGLLIFVRCAANRVWA
jgi:hypothetical protein